MRETNSFSPTLAPQHPGIASNRVRIIGVAGAAPQAGGGGLRMISEEEVFASFLVDSNESPLRACDALAEINPFPDIPWEDLRMDSGDANRRVSSKSEEMAKYVPGTSARDFFGNAWAVRQQSWHWYDLRTMSRIRGCNAEERAVLVGMKVWRRGVVLSIVDTSLVLPPPASRSLVRAIRVQFSRLIEN